MVINIEFIHSLKDNLLQKRRILDIGLLKRGLNNPSGNRKDKKILQFPVLRGEMDSADVGRRHLECRMRKGVCGKKVFKFIN
jgi:hypothetical protein